MNKMLISVVVLVIGFVLVESGPAYPENRFNSWDDPPPPLKPIGRRGRKITRQIPIPQGPVHQNDAESRQGELQLKFLDKEMKKILNCYTRLTCPQTRNARALAECDEIKDWPLYHQVMKLAGIRRYPFQNFAPSGNARRVPFVENSDATDMLQTSIPEVSVAPFDTETTHDPRVPSLYVWDQRRQKPVLVERGHKTNQS